MSKVKFTLASQRNPAFDAYTDAELQEKLDSLSDYRENRIDDGASDSEIDEIDRQLFLLDDELCARGL